MDGKIPKINSLSVNQGPAYWDQKWLEGDILFNQAKPNRFLIKHFSRVISELTTVFVPLCGKTIDMQWLSDQGHKVVGVESNQDACQSFFRERNLAFETAQSDKFTTYHSDGYTIHCGDFFDLAPSHLLGANVAYDRAALVALPPESRARYFQHLVHLLGARAKLFLITCEYVQSEAKPPPFAVLEEEARSLAKQLPVDVAETETSDPKQLKNPKFQRVTSYAEKAYWIGDLSREK